MTVLSINSEQERKRRETAAQAQQLRLKNITDDSRRRQFANLEVDAQADCEREEATREKAGWLGATSLLRERIMLQRSIGEVTQEKQVRQLLAQLRGTA